MKVKISEEWARKKLPLEEGQSVEVGLPLLNGAPCSTSFFKREDLEKAVGFKPWNEYPVGTRALSISGGEWEKTEKGWKWCTGDTFPRPGADVGVVILPS